MTGGIDIAASASTAMCCTNHAEYFGQFGQSWLHISCMPLAMYVSDATIANGPIPAGKVPELGLHS